MGWFNNIHRDRHTMNKLFLIVLLFTSTVFPQANKFWIYSLSPDNSYTIQNFEIQRYVSSLVTELSEDQIQRLDYLCSMLKDTLSIDSLPQAFDYIHIRANETQESALKNIVKRMHDGSLSTPAPLFTINEGFVGDNDTVKSITVTYNPATQGVVYTRNSSSIGVYIRNNIYSTTMVDIKHDDGGTDRGMIQSYSNKTGGENAFFAVQSDLLTAFGVAQSTSAGLIIANRTASDSMTCYKQGILSKRASTSQPVGSGNVIVFPTFNTRQIAIDWYGKGFTTIQMRGITNCFEWYMDALGKGVIP